MHYFEKTSSAAPRHHWRTPVLSALS